MRERLKFYQPTRFEFECGPRLYSHALADIVNEEADASPADPDFDACTGDVGHPGMVTPDVFDLAALVVGEVGRGHRRIDVEPARAAMVDDDPEAAERLLQRVLEAIR